MIRGVLFLLAGLLLGIVGSRALTSTEEPSGPTIPEPTRVPAVAAPAVPATGTAPSTKAEFPERFEVGSSSSPGSRLELLEAKIAQIPSPQVFAGGRIEGVALGVDQQPVEGVRVRVKPLEARVPGLSLPREKLQREDFGRYIYDRVLEHRFVVDATRTAVTDGLGYFCIEGLPEARYSIEASFPGRKASLSLSVDGGWRRWIDPGEWAVIQEVALHSVAFDVVRADGSHPDQVEIQDSAARHPHRWTPRDRVISVRAGGHRFSVEEQGHASMHASIRADRLDRPIVLRLEETAAIEVAVRYPTAVDEDREYSTWLAMAPASGGDAQWLLAHATERSFGYAEIEPPETRPVGEGTFDSLEPGTYLVGAGRRSEQVEQISRVTVAKGETAALEFDLAPIPAEALLEIFVFDANGRPADAASFSFRAVLEVEGRRVGEIDIESSDVEEPEEEFVEGRTRVALDPIGVEFLSGTRSGKLILVAEIYGGVDQEVVVSSPRVEVHLPRQSTLELQVRGIEEEETVAVIVASPTGEILFETMLFDELSFESMEVTEGDLRIFLFSEENDALLAEPRAVVVGPQPARVTIDLPPRHELVVQFPAERPEFSRLVSMTLVSAERRHSLAWLDPIDVSRVRASDTFEFGEVLPGRYLLLPHALGGLYEAMAIEVDRDTTVTYEGVPYLALEVRGLLPSDSVLRVGDKIVGAEGERFRNSAMVGLLNSTLLAMVEVRLLVERDGQTIEIELPRGLDRERELEKAMFFPLIDG